jgi:hypothetical protein
MELLGHAEESAEPNDGEHDVARLLVEDNVFNLADLRP